MPISSMASGGHFTAAHTIGTKRLIFTLSPGRCGTRWLAAALATVPSAVAYHEPQPEFRLVLRETQGDPAFARAFWKQLKLPAIAAQRAPVYVETSHLFCEGFVEPLLELGIVPDAIVIRRPHREVALSMWRRAAVPGRNLAFNAYHVQPDDPGVHVAPKGNWQDWTDYQACFWYTLEMAARADHYRLMLQQLGAQVVETSMREMVTRRGLNRLTRELGLPRAKKRPKRTNATPDSYRGKMPSGDLDEQEALFGEGT